MKKFLFALTLFCSVFAATAMASDIKVSGRVLTAFNASFREAEKVEWSFDKNMYQAKFIMDEQQYTAYFDTDGKILVVARFIAVNQLPSGLKKSLNSIAGDDVISFVFELSDEEGVHFYATVQRGEKKEMLRSVNSKKWEPYTKVKP
jgi:hypothetical protein